MDLQLGLLDSTAGDPVSVPTPGIKISQAAQQAKKKKKKAALEGKHLDPLSLFCSPEI